MTYMGPFILWESNYYTIDFYSVDNAGNSEEVKSAECKVDQVPPITICHIYPQVPDGENGWYVHPPKIIFEAFDDMSGTAVIKFGIDGGSEQTYTSPFCVSTDGGHVILYHAIDNAGNIEKTKNVSFKIDRTCPMYVTKKQVLWNTILYGAVAADNMSGVGKAEFYFNGVIQHVDPEPPFLWVLHPIPHINGSVEIKVFDKAGNWVISFDGYTSFTHIRGLIRNPTFSNESVTFYAVFIRTNRQLFFRPIFKNWTIAGYYGHVWKHWINVYY